MVVTAAPVRRLVLRTLMPSVKHWRIMARRVSGVLFIGKIYLALGICASPERTPVPLQRLARTKGAAHLVGVGYLRDRGKGMTNEQAPGGFGMARAQARWAESTLLDGIFADHFHVIMVGGMYHLTFGQMDVPLLTEQPKQPVVVGIKPMAKLIIPESAAKQLRAMLDAKIPKE